MIRPHRKPRYRARASSIHGRGVFAETDFAAGEPVCQYRGKLIPRAEMDRLATSRARRAEYRSGITYFFLVGDDHAIDGRDGGGWARLINHSCAPNCIAEADGLRIFIRTLRRVRAGEELTYDYLLEPADPRDAYRMYPCACGAHRCRKTMVDPAALRRRR